MVLRIAPNNISYTGSEVIISSYWYVSNYSQSYFSVLIFPIKTPCMLIGHFAMVTSAITSYDSFTVRYLLLIFAWVSPRRSYIKKDSINCFLKLSNIEFPFVNIIKWFEMKIFYMNYIKNKFYFATVMYHIHKFKTGYLVSIRLKFWSASNHNVRSNKDTWGTKCN